MNFDLLVYRHDSQTYLRVLDSPGGQAQGQMTLDLHSIETTDLLAQLREHPGQVYPDQVKVLGRRLFEALFSDQDIYGCYQRSLRLHKDESLRIMLRLNDVPDLASLPWEYLYDADIDAFVALSGITPIVRYIEVPNPIPTITIQHPLRILVVVASPSDLPTLDVDAEWERIHKSLQALRDENTIDLVRLPAPTLAAIRNAFRESDYHIFHFIGHGTYDMNTGAGGLMLVNAAGESEFVSADVLGTQLNDHRSLQLAFLNACHGGRSSNTHLFAGVGQRLVQQGVPASLAMQFPVTDTSATLFAHEFYQALVDGYSIESAVTDARKALDAQRRNVEWGTPVLFTRIPATPLFALPNSSERTQPMPDEQESSGINIQVGGSNSGSINVSRGDININKTIDNRKYNIGSIGGDLVEGDQVIMGDKVMGNKSIDPTLAHFNTTIHQIMTNPQAAALDQVDQQDLRTALEEFKQEALKEQVNEKRLGRLLMGVELVAPFAAKMIINALLNPGAAVSDGLRAAIQAIK